MNKHKVYCTKCFYTVYPNEGVVEQGKKVRHSNCKEMMSDRSIPRHLNPRVQATFGTMSKKKLMRLWEEYPNV